MRPLFLLALLCSAFASQATDYYLKSAAAAAPQTAASWNTAADGTGANAANFSTAGDVFIVPATLTASLSAEWVLSNVEVSVLGTLNAGSGASFKGTGTLSGSGTYNFNTTLFTAGVTMAQHGTGNASFSSANANNNIPGGTYYNLSFTTTKTFTALANIVVENSLSVGSGCLFFLSTFTLSGAFSQQVGFGEIRTFNTTANALPPGKSWQANVTYSLGGTVAAGTYTTLTLSGNNVAGGNLAISSLLKLNGSATLSVGDYTLSGSLSNQPTSASAGTSLSTTNTSSAPFPAGFTAFNTLASTIVYNGTANQTVVSGTYANLTISNSATCTTSGALTIGATNVLTIANNATYTVTGNLTINGTMNLSDNAAYRAGGAMSIGASGVLSIAAGGTLDLDTYAVTLGTGATISNSGTLKTAATGTALPTGKTWGGTVIYNRISGGQSVANGTYNNLTLSNSSGTQTAVSTLTVNGTLSTTAGGTLNMSSFALGGTLSSVSHNGTLLTDNISAAPLPANKNWEGDQQTGTVKFTSTSSQTVVNGRYGILDLSGGSRTIGTSVGIATSVTPALSAYNLSSTTLSWYGTTAFNLGAATLAGLNVNGGTVKLDGATTVTGTVAISSAVLDLDGFNLTAGSLLVSGDAPGKGVLTGNNTITLTNLVAHTEMVVPLLSGAANDYSYLAITPDRNSSWTFGIQSTIDITNPEKYLQRTWNITANTIGAVADLKFSYHLAAANLLSAAAGAWDGTGTAVVKHYNSNTSKWETLATADQSHSSTYNSITVSDIASFSPFVVSQLGATLPVSLTGFQGKREGGVNKLWWTTASESHNRGFTIERSLDGIHFSPVGFVDSKAAGGNSNRLLSYTFNDNTTAASAWYRLVQTDLDERKKTSAVVRLKNGTFNKLEIIACYPNPAGNSLKLTLQSGGGTAQLHIADAQGRIVNAQTLSLGNGANAIELNIAKLLPGVYLLQVANAIGETAKDNFVKQ